MVKNGILDKRGAKLITMLPLKENKTTKINSQIILNNRDNLKPSDPKRN